MTTLASLRAAHTGKEARTVHATLRIAEKRDATIGGGAGGDEFALAGYASLYNSPSKDLGGFHEVIRQGAFTRSLRANADVKCLFNHDANQILGRTRSGTLSLSEDSHGLKFRCQLDKNQQAHRDLYAAIKRGDVSECSFAFTVAPGGQTWEDAPEENGQKMYKRTLTDVDLIDVSAVTYPAYDGTEVGTRSERRSADYASVAADVAYAIKRASRSMARTLRESPYPQPYDYASLSESLRASHEFCELACELSEAVDDSLDDWDEQDSRSDKKAHAALRAAHADSHRCLSQASNHLALTRLAAGRCAKK
jgi:uncharacterized protein